MKFQPDTLPGANVITRSEPLRVWVGSTPFAHSVLVPWRGEVRPWAPTSAETLQSEHFERIVELAPAVVIYGSGAALRFPAAAVLRALIARGIGVETMDTAAACRTYNVLASEGRSVVAALLVGDPANATGNL